MSVRMHLLALALLAGCSSDPPPRQPPPARSEPAPAPRPRAGDQLNNAAVPDDPPPPDARLPDELTDGLLDLFLASDALEDDPKNWTDETQGPTLTITYVTSRRIDQTGATAPVAIVVSSDPSHGQFQRRSSAKVTIRRLRREAMGRLLQDLDRRGLEGLTWTEEPYDALIGPERALVLYRDGKRYRCQKDQLTREQQADFTAIERRLIELLMPR